MGQAKVFCSPAQELRQVVCWLGEAFMFHSTMYSSRISQSQMHIFMAGKHFCIHPKSCRSNDKAAECRQDQSFMFLIYCR